MAKRLGLLIVIAITILLFPALSFAGGINNVLMLGHVANYCVGPNGIWIVGQQATQCCSSGTMTQPPPAGCPSVQVLTDTSNQVAFALQAAAALAGNETSLNGRAPGTQATGLPGGPTAPALTSSGQTGAASAGETTPNGLGGTGGGPPATIGAASGSSPNRGGGGGGGANPSSSDGTDGGTSGGGSTSADQSAATAGTVLTDAGGSAAAGGGARFGSGGSASKGAAIAGIDSKTGSTDFGGKGSSTSNGAAAQIGEDPEDYFTRINLDQDIFKAVSKIYRSQSSSWLKSPLP